MNFINLVRHISFKHVKLQKTRTFMAVLGICLGVAAIVSIDIVNESVLKSFEDAITHVTGRAALQVTGTGSAFPEKMLDLVQGLPGVEYAVPVLETTASFAGGKERSFMILGVDMLQDGQIRDYSMTDESADIPDPLLFLAKADSILVTRRMAEREGIKIDQAVRVQTVQGIRTFIVRGLLDPEGPAKVADGDIAVMDIYAAQKAFGKEGMVDRIDVSFLPDETLDTMKERIQAALPEGYNLDTPAGRTRQVELMLSRFRKSMGLIGFLAIFVGIYLIYNAVSISVVQRRKEVGILRALGASRGQIVALFLGETFVISALASFLGVALGVLFAQGSVGVVAQSVTDAYVKTSVSELFFSWPSFLKDASVGIIASLLAAVFPAFVGARITPISAIRALPYSPDGMAEGRTIKILSAVFVIASLALFAAYKTADESSGVRTAATTFLSMVFLLIGMSLAVPAFLKRFMAFFNRSLSGRMGPGGRIAGLNLQKNVSRNAVAVAAIFFSIALFVSSESMIYSLTRSFIDYIKAVGNGDILVSSGHPLAVGGTPNVPMPAEMASEIEKVPGVLSVDAFRKINLNYNGARILLGNIDIVRSMEYNQYMVVEGKREDIRRLLPGQDNVMVNESLAARNGLRPGGSIVLPTPNGPMRFGVAAIVVSYASDSGSVWMDIHTYQRHWQDRLADSFSVRVKPNEKIAMVQEAILERFGKERKLFALPGKEVIEEVRKMVDRSFVVTNAVNVITLIIASLGIVVTLLASVLERIREIGILRSIGMKRGQIARVVIIESAILGSAGGLLGSGTGILIGWISFEGFFRQDFGASITYHIHNASIVWALLLAVGISALAGVYPALRAAKTNIVEALAYE